MLVIIVLVPKDLRGENALVSDHFFYFGNAAVQIPSQFSVKQAQKK